MTETKKCIVCGKKLLNNNKSEYCYKHRSFSPEYKEYKKQYYEENKERLNKKNKLYYKENREQLNKKNKLYNKENKEKISEQRKQYYKENKEKILEQRKQYYKENKEKISEQRKQYYKENKEKILNYKNNWVSKKRENDIAFRIKKNISRAISSYIKKFNEVKKFSASKYADIEKIVQRLENQFDEHMTWENYGNYWEIDHIIPQSYFDFTVEEEIKLCWNYKNLRPLEKEKNASKSNKIDEQLIIEYDLMNVFSILNKKNKGGSL